MSLRSIHNRHNFFSDYWLGTLLSSRSSSGPRLSTLELRKRLRRLTRLVDALAGTARAEPARFRERFARPLLHDVFDFDWSETTDSERFVVLHSGGAADTAVSAVGYLCPDAPSAEQRSTLQAVHAHLAATGQSHAIIITPCLLRLVRRAGDGARHASFDVALDSLRELEDEESLHVAYRVLSAGSFRPGPDGKRAIDALEEQSREHSAKVSTELKAAVFEAAERVVGAFQREVAQRQQEFEGSPPTLTDVRDAGFLALYRLLFILYAESRDERLAAHALYRESYGLDALIKSLLETPLEHLAANRTRIWSRIRVLFRVFNDGLSPNIEGLENIPPRGGRLFSDATPEGSLLSRLSLDDRTAARVLLSLATTRPRRGIGRERVSYRELEIEQLGSVYEGLLEYEPAVADQLRLLVRTGGRDLALTPEELVLLCERKRLVLGGESMLVLGTVAEQLHPSNIPDEETDQEEEDDDEAVEEEAGDEEGLTLKAGQPVRLLRRLEQGEFYFRPGGARKASGSFYTPTPMVDFLVREAVGPLVEGKSAHDIEALRIVDLACGSAHFLVGAARFLGARLHDAYRRECGDDPPPGFAPPGSQPGIVRERWAREGAAWCKRRIVERCLYGVDLNPAAVQLAQVSLWIESLAGDRPLSFFAHHIRVGNSLQGTFADRFDTTPDPRFFASRGDTLTLGLFESNIRQRIEQALGERRLIDAELPPEIRGDTTEEFAYKEDRLRRSEAALAEARLLMDLRSASPYIPAIWADLPTVVGSRDPASAARARPWWPQFEEVRQRERFFHWELEFPEVLLRPERPGFDVVLGNPPWDKVLPSKLAFYADVDPLITAWKGNEVDRQLRALHRAHPGLEERYEQERERITTFARVLRKGGDFPLARPRVEESEEEDGTTRRRHRRSEQNAHEELAKYFVDRSLRLARQGGAVGLVVPSVIYNGDGNVGLRQFLLNETAITAFYGFENRRRIFPIHASYKFANLVARIGAEGAGAFDAAFMRHHVAELSSPEPKPWMVRVTRDEIAQLSPATLAFLEFRGAKDQEIVQRMTVGKPTFGGAEPGAWGTRLISWRQHEVVYNASEDKDLFTNPATERLHTPESVLGPLAPADPASLADAMREAGFFPVYEGKHVEQYLVGVKPVRWWLSVDQAFAKYEQRPRESATLVFRETASNTNQRTCIAAVLPERSAASHKLTGVDVRNVETDAALTVLNSMCFDFLLRLRSAGTNVSFTYIEPVAVPSASVVNALPRIGTRFAPAVGLSHISDDPAIWPDLWAADRAVAQAYGLGPEEFSHIMATFPVWRRKRAGIAAYYDGQLEEWRREQS